MPLQGNVDLSGTPVSSGSLVVEIWDGPDVAGSTLIYNSTDNYTGTGNISAGKFDIVLGSVGDELNLEYGKVYYMDLFIAGNNMNFSGQERQVFMSSVGIINSSFLNTSNDYEVNSLLIDNKTAITNAYLNISDGATPKFVVMPDGNVGIGTTIPANKLEVTGDLNVTQGNTTLYGGLEVVNSSDTTNSYLFVDNETGNVGIGTTSPGAKLEIGSGQLILPVGSQTAPSLTFSGLTNYGIYSTSGNIDFTLNGASVAFIGATTMGTPSTIDVGWYLDTYLVREAARTLGLRSGTNAVDFNLYNTYTSATNYERAELNWAANSNVFTIQTTAGSGGGTVRNIALMGGNVGIGTTAPSKTLEVVGTAAVGDLNATSATVANNITAQDSVIATKAVYGPGSFVVDGGGNVGIGTASPLSKLHINGGTGTLATGLTFGDGDTGFYELSDDVLIFTNKNDDHQWIMGGGWFGGYLDRQMAFVDEIASATNPVLVFRDDVNTGIGSAGVNILSLIAGGTNGLNIISDGNVGIGTSSPGATLEVVNKSAVDALFNVTDGSDTRFVINGDGSIVIGGSESPQNSSMKLTIIGGDLNVSGAVFSQGLVLSSPFVVKSAQGEPIPICMKNYGGKWVGCMPDENNNWVCAPNRECDEKVLGLETTWKLKEEGASDEEIDKKVGALRQKFKQEKDLETIKSEVRAEIGDMSVLRELDDTLQRGEVYGVQTQDVSTSVNEDIIALKTENSALRNELSALKEDIIALKALFNQNQAETAEQQSSGEPMIEPSLEPADINNTGLGNTDQTREPTEESTERGFSITGASFWHFFSRLF